jgi:transcription termination/antitermination protein NusA
MSEITKSIEFICDEKGLDHNIVMEAVETALGAAYRKDFGNRQQNIKVKFDPETSDMKMWDVKTVVEDIAEDVLESAQAELTARREKAQEENRELTEEEIEDLPRFNPKLEMMITPAKETKADVNVGDVLEIELEIPGDFGRMAAQTAKQVIIQKLREAERNSVFEDFKNQEGEIVQGIIQRRDRSGTVIIDLGKITGLLKQQEQIPREFYKPGTRMRFYVISVEMGNRGPEILLSRSHEGMVRTVFAQEIPEVDNGDVEIKAIARDAGQRSKVAVATSDESIDPIGSCIGQRGSRITTIIDELGGEKIDVIQFHEDAAQFIQEALSPANVSLVELSEDGDERVATAHVADDQFSLAIGRGGQNVRLASALTGWQINVVQLGGGDEEEVESQDDADEPKEDGEDEHVEEEDANVDEPAESTEDSSLEAETEAVPEDESEDGSEGEQPADGEQAEESV